MKEEINSESAAKEIEKFKAENRKLEILLNEKTNQLSELTSRLESDKNVYFYFIFIIIIIIINA